MARPSLDTGLWEIPEGGYVISGHEAAHFWVIENLPLGRTVDFR